MKTLILVAALVGPSAMFGWTSACSSSRASEVELGEHQRTTAIHDSALASQPEPALALQSDADIKLAAKIRTAILQDHRVASQSDSVTIVVRGGWVALQGRAKDAEQKQVIEEVARAVAGVERVDNLLVTPAQ